MTLYVVIENTPGYLPEEDDPFVTDDYQAAVEYMNERLAELVEQMDAVVIHGYASSANLAAAMVEFPDRSHDLGRWIGVEIAEED